jgi:Putative cyclase
VTQSPDAAAVAPSSGGTKRSGAQHDGSRVLTALGQVKTGRIHSLALTRFPGMPLFAGHPDFTVLSYRTPQGMRAAGTRAWPGPNDAGLGYVAEVVSGTTHTGAHIDAHAHMTIGEHDRWFGGSAQQDLGDFGPLKGDASELDPIWTRGVLYDVPRFRGCDSLMSCSASGRPSASPRLVRVMSCSSAPGICGTGPTRLPLPPTAEPARTSASRNG